MKHLVTLTLVLVAFALSGVQCSNTATRPQRLSQQELQSRNYDRFFVKFAGKPYADLDASAPAGHGAMIYCRATDTGHEFAGAKGAAAAWLSVDEHPAMVLMAMYDAALHRDPPCMQLQLLARRDTGENTFIGDLGDPVVLCDLSREQCDAVLAGEVPDSLIDEMVQVANDANWRPLYPETNIYHRIMYVEPDGHFD